MLKHKVDDRRSEVEDRRDHAESPHMVCTAHSGLNTKTNIHLVLSSVAVILLGVCLTILVKIETGVATNELSIKIMRVDMDKMELKMKDLERFHIRTEP